MNWQEYRNSIRQNGKTKTRQNLKSKQVTSPILVNGQEIGWVVKFWSPIYCSWAWKATVLVDSKLYHKTKLDSEEAITWAKCKWSVLSSGRKYFAESLKEWLTLQDKSIVDLAEEVGCSRDVVYKWMNGDSYPSVEFLVRICQVFNPKEWEKSYTAFSRMIDLEK